MSTEKEIMYVYQCDWNGKPGWSCDGWGGETKEEAGMERCIQEALEAGKSEGEAADRAHAVIIVEG